MSKTLSSAQTFQTLLKNISSDNKHLCFSSHRAHKIEEEIQIYYHPCVHFCECTEEEQVLFAHDTSDKTLSSAETFLVLLKNIVETTNISASHHTERIKLKKKHVDISSTVCSLLRVHRRGTKVVFCSRHERQKFSKMHHRFLAQKWSNNTDDDGGASTSKIESMRTTTTALVETYENGREIWYARSRTRKRFRKSSLESS